ncbi:MAG: cobalamin biosynthesis protein CbiM [Elusimicrobia bacterium]|nr:cobalamin biosynthesis protein CbiM [Elusimicrobiota bacterium]
MHIPDSMMNGSICPVTALVSTAGIGAAVYASMKSKNKPGSARFAAITALVFAGQMMNFPINGGTSGHLLGGVLASALLGIPFGIISIAVVVAIQSLVFSDGGFSVLGVNIFNMALIGAGLGGLIHYILNAKAQKNPISQALSLGAAAWISVMAAAFAVSLQLSFSGTIPFSQVVGAMLTTHAFIGIGEALITVAAVRLFGSHYSEHYANNAFAMPLLASGIIAAMLSPFASGLPDGLEWVAEKYRFLHEAAPSFVSPMPDYLVPAVTHEALATGLAGLAGVIISFVIGMSIAIMLQKVKVTPIK